MSIISKIKRKLLHLRLQPIRVFCFHQVSAVFDPPTMWECDWTEIEQFKRNILKLKEKYTFISLSEAYSKLARCQSPFAFRLKKYAVLTSDDGWASLKEILPWLMDQNIRITLFLNPCYLDGKHYQERETEKLLTIQDIRVWTKQYDEKINIASHSWEHSDCAKQNEGVFKENVDKSICCLQNESGYIPFFAYPCGRHTPWQDEYLLRNNVVPVYCDGQKNYNDKNIIHRECIDYETLRNHPVL